MNKINIFQSIKLSMVAIIAIVVAQVLHLEFSISAGIVVILSIGQTKIETVKTAIQRFYAFVVALMIAYGCFYFLDFTVEAFFVYLFIYIFFCKYKNYNSSIAMNSVLISHFVTMQSMNFDAVYNEVMLFFIGVGFGVVSNLHLRKDHYYIKLLKLKTDEQIKEILFRIAFKIKGESVVGYDGGRIDQLITYLNEVKEIVDLNYLNQFNQQDTFDIEYVSMRYEQVLVLNQMYLHTCDLQSLPISARYISECLEMIGSTFHEDNDVVEIIHKLATLNDMMKEFALPKSRDEFEERAKLFVLLKDIERFVNLKRDFLLKHKN